MADSPSCPRCFAPRGDGAECPRCGVIYAKASERRAREQAAAEPMVVTELGAQQAFAPGLEAGPAVEESEEPGELRLRRIAIPAALAVFWVLEQSNLLHALIRTFLSMWIHELGHAVTAWLCGVSAVPGPWRTSISDERSAVVILFFFAAWTALGLWAVRARRWGWAAAAAGLLIAQAWGSLALPFPRAQALISFGGDAGLFVLGAALLLSFYAPADSALVRGQLRWGLLGLGAAAFVDGLVTWWAVKQDWANLPMGDIEGVGGSDPTVLVDRFGWTETQLLHRYLGLAAACGVVVLAVWAWHAAPSRGAARWTRGR